jgi:hypothetical protein
MIKRKKASKKSTSSKRYVSRPSQITKRSPTKRLKKRRKRNVKSPKRGFFPNPVPFTYIITARSTERGPRMHYDGSRFSQRAKIRTFSTFQKAHTTATQLLKQYPVLRKYRIAIETPQRP